MRPALLLLALAAAPALAHGQARQQATVIMSEDEGSRRFQDGWGYSDAVVACDSVPLAIASHAVRVARANPIHALRYE